MPRRHRNHRAEAAYMREWRARIVLFLRQMKSQPCADCGGRFDPVCMDFDHRPGEVKLFNLGSTGKNSRGQSRPNDIERLRAEIAKCDVVCANCHRVRTFRKRDHGAITTPARPVHHELPQLALGLSALEREDLAVFASAPGTVAAAAPSDVAVTAESAPTAIVDPEAA